MHAITETTSARAYDGRAALAASPAHGTRARSDATRLGTSAIKAHPQVKGTFFPAIAPSTSEDFDAMVWRLQAKMWSVSQLTRLQGCGRWLAPNAGAASVEWSKNFARFGQLQNSRSVWASPWAASRIATLRSAEVGEALKTWCKKSPDHRVYFLTLTIAHDRTQALSQLWDAVAKCWRGVTQGAAWRGNEKIEGDKKRFGIEHWVKSTEVTHGKNGWHVHIHASLLVSKRASNQSIEELGDRIFARWKNAAVKIGLKAPSREHGIDIAEISAETDRKKLANYLTKSQFVGLGAELSSGGLKTAKGGNRTPFQILDDTTSEDASVRASSIALWREWESSSSGRRQMAWSKGAKAELGVADMTDQELLELDENRQLEELKKIALITAMEWKKIRSNVEIRRHILHCIKKAPDENAARTRLYQMLDEVGVKYLKVDSPGFTPSVSS